MNLTLYLFSSTDKNAASSSFSADAAAIAKGKQPVVEALQVSASETTQAPPSPRSIMRKGRARMEHISRNMDNIAQNKMEKFRAKLLTSPRTEQLYLDILISGVWSDGNLGSLKKPNYVFGDSSDCKEHHSTEHITFSFIDTTRETITVSIEHTYRRGSSALVVKPTTTARDDSKIAWGTGKHTFKIGIF